MHSSPPEHCCEYFAPSWRKTLRNWACTGITDNGLRAGTNSNLATRRIPYHQDLSRAYFSMLRSRLHIFVDSEENEASAEFRLPLADLYKIWASSGFRLAPVPLGEGVGARLRWPRISRTHTTTQGKTEPQLATLAQYAKQMKEWAGKRWLLNLDNKIALGWTVNSTNIL